MRFSKSKYCTYVSCPKKLWLQEFMPEKEVISADAQSRMEQGTEAGKLARGCFGKYELAEIMVGGKPDTDAMIKRTKELMAAGAQVICEAAFAYKNNYCAVDILRKEGGGWAIYEVKSVNSIEDKHKTDAAYQRYVLEKCGINVASVYILHFNRDYMRHGDIDIKGLFTADDVLKDTQKFYVKVEDNLIGAEKYLSQTTEPVTVFSAQCKDCGFRAHCHRDIPKQSVLNLRDFAGRNDYANDGIITFNQVRSKGINSNLKKANEILLQLTYDTPAKGTYIDKVNIRAFLKKLSYPLYFLDFETFQSALPPLDNSRTWQQIPSQYSLHWIESDADAKKFLAGCGNNYEKNLNGNLSGGAAGKGNFLKHTEFLGDSVNDPRRGLAERLCKDIPLNVCVLAYNKTFECTRLGELADLYPDLHDYLLNIRDHVVDLAEPFKNYFYYNSAMQGRYSIKYVLPAIYPHDPSLSYSGLVVKNGTDAMLLYPKLKDMPHEKQEQARLDLLKYCELDTLAMVKLWQELVRVS